MVKKLLLFTLMLTCFKTGFSTSITGTDTAYVGYEIIAYKQADPFTGKEQEIGKTIVRPDGSFDLEFDIKETVLVFMYFGIHKAHIYAETDKDYQVALPPRRDKKSEDKLNPFFTYIETHLGVVNEEKNGLNMSIRMFNDSFYPFYKKHTEKVFANDLEFEQLDKDIEQLDKPFSKSTNQYFNEYRKYKYGMLRFIAYQHKSKSVSDIYFKNQEFQNNNPAFTELFNMVYDGYFGYFSRTAEGKQLASAIAAKSYSQLKNVLAQDEVLQPEELLNMVILRCLHHEFYDDNYSRSAMLMILDSLIASSDNIVEIETAKSIRDKVTQLLAGYAPPQFELYDIDSNLVGLEQFKGKFIYLNFCSCFSYTCLNEFVMLQNLYRKHNKYLEIVTVVIDDDVQVMKDFLLRSGYQWTFLHFDNQPDIFKDYDVRVFPTYYLIDHEGKLSMSPAPAPAEEFEGRLFKVLRAKGIL
jgi:peroxiredoxin